MKNLPRVLSYIQPEDWLFGAVPAGPRATTLPVGTVVMWLRSNFPVTRTTGMVSIYKLNR